jgi:uncharacterized repeat protein (TIGR02543 family)/LPXTG-motif cell wall-anchored protein
VLRSSIKKTLTMSLTASVLLASMPASASGTTYDVNNTALSFIQLGSSTGKVLGAATASTAPVRYENVITISGTRIDALVSLIELSNSESSGGLADNKLNRIDKIDTDPNASQARELEATFTNSTQSNGIKGHAIVDIQFVLSGTNTPVTLTNVVVSVADIDNDQFVQFSGLSSYKRSTSLTVEPRTGTNPTTWGSAASTASRVSALTGSNASFTTSGGTSLTANVPDGSVMFFASESSSQYRQSSAAGQGISYDLFVAQVNFAQVSTLRANFGSYSTGDANLDFSFETFGNFSSVTPVTVTQPTFTIAYDANTGTGTAPSSTSGTGSLTVAGSLTTPGISKSGFTFAGWNTRADGTGVAYSPGSTILPVANTTLYAVWNVAPTPTPTPTATPAPAPASTTPPARLAATGANVEWLMVGGLVAAVAGSVFLAASRRKRVW